MSDTQKHTKPNVPNLRFPGFEGEWELHLLSDYCQKITRKNKGNYLSNVLCNSANQGIIPQSEYFDRAIANSDNTAGYYIIEHDDFVYNPRKSTAAPYGPVNVYQGSEPGIISPLYLCFKTTGINREFLFYYFKSKAWWSYMYENGDSGARHDRVSIKDDVFFAMPIHLPSLQEQGRIAKLLSILDQRIAVQNKVIEDLIPVEKEIINHVYKTLNSPLKPLSMIAERVTTKNRDSLCINVLTISARDGLISQLDFFNTSVASHNLSNYLLLKKGDFAYNKSYSADHPWGAIKHLEEYEEGVLSPLYFCFRPQKGLVDTDYLQLYFETDLWHKHISEISVEGARNHGLLNMSVGDFMALPVPVPDLDIQYDIVRSLKSIRNKKLNEMKYREFLLRQKDYLLSHCFL